MRLHRFMSSLASISPVLREYKGCRLLYNDEYMMALEKPSGMCSVAGRERLLHFNGTGYISTNGVAMPPKRNVQWVTAIQRTIEQYRNHDTLQYISKFLSSINIPSHIPRKQKQFHTFLTRTLHLNDSGDKEKLNKVWECLQEVDKSLYAPKSIGIYESHFYNPFFFLFPYIHEYLI